MNSQAKAISNDSAILIEDVRALLSATTDAAEEKVKEAHKRLTAAIKDGGKLMDRLQDKAVEGARYTDKAMHDHPYQAVTIAFGVGLLIGHIATHR